MSYMARVIAACLCRDVLFVDWCRQPGPTKGYVAHDSCTGSAVVQAWTLFLTARRLIHFSHCIILSRFWVCHVT